jgi:hypothetical protein
LVALEFGNMTHEEKARLGEDPAGGMIGGAREGDDLSQAELAEAKAERGLDELCGEAPAPVEPVDEVGNFDSPVGLLGISIETTPPDDAILRSEYSYPRGEAIHGETRAVGIDVSSGRLPIRGDVGVSHRIRIALDLEEGVNVRRTRRAE